MGYGRTWGLAPCSNHSGISRHAFIASTTRAVLWPPRRLVRDTISLTIALTQATWWSCTPGDDHWYHWIGLYGCLREKSTHRKPHLIYHGKIHSGVRCVDFPLTNPWRLCVWQRSEWKNRMPSWESKHAMNPRKIGLMTIHQCGYINVYHTIVFISQNSKVHAPKEVSSHLSKENYLWPAPDNPWQQENEETKNELLNFWRNGGPQPQQAQGPRPPACCVQHLMPSISLECHTIPQGTLASRSHPSWSPATEPRRTGPVEIQVSTHEMGFNFPKKHQ